MRIGTLVTVGAIVLMAFLFFIGSEQRIFARKYEYRVRFESVSGLAEGNPVELAGVTVGTVKDIFLPREPTSRTVDITIVVERKYADRIREDSRARMKKLGLISADTYVDITPGSPEQPVLDPGSVIQAQRATDVDTLISSGEDLVDNFVQISYSLKNVLQRIDRGEGLIGELTTEPEVKERLTDTLARSFGRIDSFLAKIESGKGVIGKLVYDEEYADQLTDSLRAAAGSLRTVSGSIEESFKSGRGALPALLSDPGGREKVTALIDRLTTTSENLAVFTQQLRAGDGVIPRLVGDKEYADKTLDEFQQLVARLDEVSRRLAEGEGTAGLLISDPSVYEAINDVLIGINESRLLRWLIRSRQQKGIETRHDAAQRGGVKEDVATPGQPDRKLPEESKQSPEPDAGVDVPAADAAPTEDAQKPPPVEEVMPEQPVQSVAPAATSSTSAEAPPAAPQEPSSVTEPPEAPQPPPEPHDPNEPKFRAVESLLVEAD